MHTQCGEPESAGLEPASFGCREKLACLRTCPAGNSDHHRLRVLGLARIPSEGRAEVTWAAALLLAVAGLNASAGRGRDRSEVRAFRSANPCPATSRIRGACPGWHVDHIIALCAGGPDKRENMQWITREDHRSKTFVDVRECRKAKRAP